MPQCPIRCAVAVATLFLAFPLLAQQLPLQLDPQWTDLGDKLTFQVTGNKPDYEFDVADCPDSDSQCVVLTTNLAVVYLTYTLDAKALRGKRVRFAASLLRDFPGISRVQLFMRVDRVAGVGFHQYTDSSRDDPPTWLTHELIGPVADDAKQISIGLRLTGLGTVYFADPKLEAAAD